MESHEDLTVPQCAEWTLNRIEKLSTRPLRDERACFRGSESILFEILDSWPSEKTETL